MRAIYSGSFDPITYGHMDVIERASNIFSRVSILIPLVSDKNSLITPLERQHVIEEIYADNDRIDVIVFDGLLVDWMLENSASIIVRGIRDSVDMASEWRMAHCNKVLHSEIETLFLASSPTVSHISSTLVKEIIACGGDLSKFIPDAVVRLLDK